MWPLSDRQRPGVPLRARALPARSSLGGGFGRGAKPPSERQPPLALRLDDVGAASKQHEVYGATRIPVGSLRLPFPGNLLFLKYLPPIKRWGPYPELTAAEWHAILAALAERGATLTVAVTAGWV